jgi:acetyl-CoA C-acetyltransferase
MRPDDLTAQMMAAALSKVPEVDPNQVDDLMLGVGQPGGEQGFNIARNVAIQLGYDELPGTTVNRYCASSLQTARMAMHAIKAGEGDTYIAGGVETISRFFKGESDSLPDTQNPLYDDAQERTERLAAGEGSWTDPRARGLLPDAYADMGQTAENVAQLTGISRAEQDRWALLSQTRASEAINAGHYEREITPVTLPDGTLVSTDDSPRPGSTLEGLEKLNPAFRPNGTVTAGNSCPLNDGAAALVIMSDTRAKELGLTPLARIVATSTSAISPEIMGLGPIEATRKVLKQAGMTINDIDLFEINEAFAVQVLASARELNIEEDILNVSGGAIALGHPYGMTGARIAISLLNNLASRDQQFGLETMCVAGGQGMAMIIERLY